MLKKTVVAASAAAVVLGAGTAALASSGSATSHVPNPSSAAPADTAVAGTAVQGNGHRRGLRVLRGALHAQWVTRNGSSATFVTHDAIRGVVTAVSASSITVKAADGISQSYAVTSSTKVALRAAGASAGNPGSAESRGSTGRTKAGTISDVHTGDKVAVIGTGTTSLTAGQIFDRVR